MNISAGIPLQAADAIQSSSDAIGGQAGDLLRPLRRGVRLHGVRGRWFPLRAGRGGQGRGDRLGVVRGGANDPLAATEKLLPGLGPGPVVVGAAVPSLDEATESARAALAGFRAAPAWPGAPRPVAAADLLPERALAGDSVARRILRQDVYGALERAGGELLETLDAFFAAGGVLESAARALFVHPNTVRYRLRRIADVTGFAPANPRDAFALRIALTIGRLDLTAPTTSPHS